VVGILQEQLLLLQLGNKLGPAHLDGVVAGLRQGGETMMNEPQCVNADIASCTSVMAAHNELG
jgi:hypothetical protein